jgi:hypothetical protein
MSGTMRHLIGVGCTAAVTTIATFLAANLPCAADSATIARSYDLRTRIVEQPPSVGEYDGSLQIRISPAGIVSGYYRADDSARFISVSGGVTGDRFWIDIGAFSARPLHFSGTLLGGTDRSAGGPPVFRSGSLCYARAARKTEVGLVPPSSHQAARASFRKISGTDRFIDWRTYRD